MRVVGLMSGTSTDGIDAAAAEIELEAEELTLSPLRSLSREYPPELRDEIEAALPPAATSAYELFRLDTLIGQELAGVAEEAIGTLCEGRAELVVSHGQTMYHWVEDGAVRGTLQLGEAAWISARTGLPTISNLRARDVAAGGQGAPLVALFDRLLLAGSEEPKAALNLGVIANLTVVRTGEEPLAYDTGLASTRRANAKHFDGDVPERAITVGLSTILQAREILLLASGEEKAEAVATALEGDVTPDVPASALREHPRLTLLADRSAASRLA